MVKRLVFINSHPIQYFAPLYREIARQTDLFHMEVWYLSDESIKGMRDRGFSSDVKWDIPLIEGYPCFFLKNISPIPSIFKGFWGLINPGLIIRLLKMPPSVIVVHGWAYLSNVMAIISAKLLGHKVCIRAETPISLEISYGRFRRIFRRFIFKFLFIFIDEFLFIGEQNRRFYKYYGISDKKLIFTPYAVDNERFQQSAAVLDKISAKARLGIASDTKVILFSGKYISKKKPLDLLQSFYDLGASHSFLIMIGEGELRTEMEAFIRVHSLSEKVLLTGFVNQSIIPAYYRAADLFVMCSGKGETWGLAVNEALNFGIPVIVSDDCGCAVDLVEEDITGSVFKSGDVRQLTFLMRKYLAMDDSQLLGIGKAALKKINQYDYENIIKGLCDIDNKTT